MKIVTLSESKAQPCTPWEFAPENESGAGRAVVGQSTLEAMEHLLRTSKLPNGLVPVAIAAPQVGIFKRFFLIAPPGDPARWVFNPKVTVLTKKRENGTEGCLTVPGEKFLVQRWRTVKVEAQDQHGQPFTWNCQGLLGRIIQHEVDHLDGKCIKDFATPITEHRAAGAQEGL